MTICREKLSPKAYGKIFVLTYDRLRRYEGVWHLERQLMFPGHIFLESENEEFLSEELGKYSDTVEYQKHLIRMSQEKEMFLKRLCKEEFHLKMSKGIICKGNTQITEGPLKGLENRICRIDRHKRLAKIEMIRKPDEVRPYGKKVGIEGKSLSDVCYVTAGLEITEKIV